VDRALKSNAVLALLVRFLRPGTKEEIEAAYRSRIPLKVLYCPPGGDPATADKKLRRFLQWLQGGVLYRQCGDPASQSTSEALYDELLDIALQHVRSSQLAVPYESR
jgi:hypothetical protein